MDKGKAIELHLMSGREALNAENIISLFEKLKGRKATDQERQECIDDLAAIKARPPRAST